MFYAIKALNPSGILFVASPGNDANDNDAVPRYPAGYNTPNIISVGATNCRDGRAYFSNYGARTVHMAAPGEYILSTTPGGTYEFYSGTSMAAPHVSGAAALVLAVNPSITVKRLRAALMYSGDVIGVPNTQYYTLDFVSGRRLNALQALQNVSENDTTPPAAVSNFQTKFETDRQFTLTWAAPGDNGGTGSAAIYEIRFTDKQPTTAAQFEAGATLLAPFPDAAVTSTNTDSAPSTDGYVEVLPGNGAGGLLGSKSFRVGESPRGIVTGDFNRDGKPDLASANQSYNISVLLGNGAGGFTTASYNLNPGDLPENLAVGDFNKDGKQDLAVAASFPFSMTGSYGVYAIMQGNGSGAFSVSHRTYVSGDPMRRIVAADMNGDGKDDVFGTR